jgi:hypothetical protein
VKRALSQSPTPFFILQQVKLNADNPFLPDRHPFPENQHPLSKSINPLFVIPMPCPAKGHDSFANQRVYQEIYVSNPQNERLRQVINIDDSGGCHAMPIINANGSAGYIA